MSTTKSILIPQPLFEQISSLSLAEELSQEAETENEIPKHPSKETVDLTYEIDISNIKPKEVRVADMFGVSKQKTYDLSCFSSVKYQLGVLSRKIKKEYPDWDFKIYAYRCTIRTKNTVLKKLAFSYNFDEIKKFVHINVEGL